MSNSLSSKVVQPYVNFDGRCEEAANFYHAAIGAEVLAMHRFKEVPAGSECPGADGEKIMHCALKIGDSTVMASDCQGQGKPEFKGITLSLGVKTEEAARQNFDALAAGGKIEMPLQKTFWSPAFGMLTDKFGVSWMINAECEQPQA